MNIAPSAVAQVSRPDCNGFRPKPSCSSSGIRNGVAPTPMRKSASRSHAVEERRDAEQPEVERWMRRSGARGRRRARGYGAARDARGGHRPSTTDGRPAPRTPASAPTGRRRTSAKPRQSNGGTACSRRFGMKRCTRTRPRTPIGTLMMKIQRQWKYSVMAPPKRRPDHRPQQRRNRQVVERGDVFVLGHGAHQDEPPHRHHHRAAHPLQEARAA